MRWSDIPAQVAWRTLGAWRDAMQGKIDAAKLESIADRVRGSGADDSPLLLLSPGARRVACDHVARSPLERGGLLLGEPLVARTGAAQPAAVFVRAAVPGQGDDATEYSLRLGTAVWDTARAALAPGEVVVGWFHSHPDLGAFFSGTDRRTQASFFNHPFSVGWVIDPVRRAQAWFAGAQSRELTIDSVIALD